jgi:NitT/TauT family transport system substrate-binding protein
MIRFLIAACIFSLMTPAFATKASKKPIGITLNWKAEPEFGGFYQAVLANTFNRPWEELAVIEGGASTPTIQMVAAGKIDFAIANGDEVVISRALGTDVVAIFATYQKDPHGIMVHEDSGVASLKDLMARADFTIALQRGIGSTLFVQKKFAPLKAKIVPFTGGITTYLNDKKFAQQCFVTSEPLVAKKQGKPAKSFLVAEKE